MLIKNAEIPATLQKSFKCLEMLCDIVLCRNFTYLSNSDTFVQILNSLQDFALSKCTNYQIWKSGKSFKTQNFQNLFPQIHDIQNVNSQFANMKNQREYFKNNKSQASCGIHFAKCSSSSIFWGTWRRSMFDFTLCSIFPTFHKFRKRQNLECRKLNNNRFSLAWNCNFLQR